MSGGERRRVEIARALANDPKFILLDEPFAGVDPISVEELKEIIASLAKRRIGILITDHNVRETLDICDKAYIVNRGKIIAQGDPSAILENDEVKKVYLKALLVFFSFFLLFFLIVLSLDLQVSTTRLVVISF